MESHEVVSYKELPTREQKLRRNQDRRNSPTFPHIRSGKKGCISPTNDPDIDKSFSDRSMSSSPETVNLQMFANSAFHGYYKLNPRVDPSSPSADIACDQSSTMDFDQPLDMTTKQRPNAQQQRPSVITCASALLQTQCNASHDACGGGSAEELRQSCSDNSNDSVELKKDMRTGRRREVLADSCDPVIDEHFRRSLGKDYQQIFSKTSANSVSITVDDHFAKALGDTWLQLQQSKNDSPTPAPPQNLHSKQTFLKHSPEIVSS